MFAQANLRVKRAGMEPAGESSMKKSAFRKLIVDEIDDAAGNILTTGTLSDDIALGRLKIFLSLRRTLDSKTTPEDVGVWDALNDIFRLLSVLNSEETIFSRLEV
jgi:hypothetical protein